MRVHIVALFRAKFRVTHMNLAQLDDKGLVIACQRCGQRNRLQYGRLEHAVRCGKCKSEIPPPSNPIEIMSGTDFHALINASSLPVLIDFWAPWCGPCKVVAPEIEKVAARSAGKLIVAKVNTEQFSELAREYQVSSIPALAVFNGGREVARTAGARPADAILAFVRQSAGTQSANV
jgi:thioredoxin 2